jgi:hypothetical protein
MTRAVVMMITMTIVRQGCVVIENAACALGLPWARALAQLPVNRVILFQDRYKRKKAIRTIFYYLYVYQVIIHYSVNNKVLVL